MTTQMNRTRFRILFVVLATGVSLGCAVACSSSDQAPGEGRLDHPNPALSASPPKTILATPSAQASSTPAAPAPQPTSLAEADESCSGSSRYPLDKAIAEDDPARPWSKNVPKRPCANDNECGDGFCDRGRCAAIWTSTLQYGQRCERDCPDYGHLPCIDGRYRSCISDKECEWARDMQDPKCIPDASVPGARECYGVVGSGLGRTRIRSPLPQKPQQ